MLGFEKVKGCEYKFKYEEIFKDIQEGKLDKARTYRQLILNDLWFIVYFIFEIEEANHPYVVGYCRAVEEGPGDYTLDLVAREHFKTTIITKAEVIQKVLRNPEERIGIFSHTRPSAKSFLRGIKSVLESKEELINCFPEVLYKNPLNESPKWSEDDGLIVKRRGLSYNESTIEAWGLLFGMPTGKHYTHRVYDDIETADLVGSPEVIEDLKEKFNLSQNLATKEGTHRVLGTPYHHLGVLTHIRDMADKDGKRIYYLRKRAATSDGTAEGKPVFLSQKRLDALKVNEYQFNCQQLCNPTPLEDAGRLRGELLKEIHPDFIPADVFKFIVIDPAGEKTDDGRNAKRNDCWAIHLIGVQPQMDNLGLSNVYIIDSVIDRMTTAQANDCVVRMYLKGGIVMQVGVEKVGVSNVELHVANALMANGFFVSVENKTLVILTPGGRSKVMRIKSALELPLIHGKICISQFIASKYKDRLRMELDNFPYWHDDGIDALSYGYDMLRDFRFPSRAMFNKRIDYDFSRVGIV